MIRKRISLTVVLTVTLLTGCHTLDEPDNELDSNVNHEIQAFLATQPHEKVPPAPKQSFKPKPSKPVPVVQAEADPTETVPISEISNVLEDGPPQQFVQTEGIHDASVKHEPRSRYGNPPTYQVLGKRYAVMQNGSGYHDRGIASWYGTKFHNKLTANRETYDMYKMTAAHKTLPIPSFVRVTNLQNGKQVTVRVNDRGPFHENRIIDLSYVAAKKLGILGHGTGLVDVELIETKSAYAENQDATTHTVAIDHDPKIYLQIGAFSQRFNADAHAKRLAKRFHQSIHVTHNYLDHREIWRVQLGPVKSVQESDTLTHAVKLAGFGNALAVVR